MKKIQKVAAVSVVDLAAISSTALQWRCLQSRSSSSCWPDTGAGADAG